MAPARTMIDAQLLDILVCPESKQPVHLADDELVAEINAAIEARSLINRGGKTVREAIQGGLLREDGEVLYAIRDEIPIMLLDEAIETSQLS